MLHMSMTVTDRDLVLNHNYCLNKQKYAFIYMTVLMCMHYFQTITNFLVILIIQIINMWFV